MADATASNDIGRYNAAYGAYKSAVAEKEAYTKDAATLAGVDEAALARKQGALDNYYARTQAAQTNASARAQQQIDALAGKAAQTYTHTHDVAMKQATEASTKFAADMLAGQMRPGETPESVFTTTYNRAMSTVPGFVPVAPPAVDPQAAVLAAAQAEKARRQQGK
jgi:selenocysteine lyase/cysteine desulfurase